MIIYVYRVAADACHAARTECVGDVQAGKPLGERGGIVEYVGVGEILVVEITAYLDGQVYIDALEHGALCVGADIGITAYEA